MMRFSLGLVLSLVFLAQQSSAAEDACDATCLLQLRSTATEGVADEEPSIVVDMGSYSTKAGFSCNDVPTSHFPSVVASGQRGPFGQSETKVGAAAFATFARDSDMAWPARGELDMENLDPLYHHTFYNELRVPPEEWKVLLTSPVGASKEKLEGLTEMMFNNHNVPELALEMQGAPALFASGRTTGIVVDIGDAQTSVVPVVEGRVFRDGIETLDVAGKHITDFLATMLVRRRNHFGKHFGLDKRRFAADIKEKLTYVALDYDEELEEASFSDNFMKLYEMPDGETITVSMERLRAPEILFKPSFIGNDADGVHKVIEKSIEHCDADIRKEMWGNIVLTGGSTLFPGFPDRLQKELLKLAPVSMKVKVIAPPERLYTNWIGSSMLACGADASSLWTDRDTWEEERATAMQGDKDADTYGFITGFDATKLKKTNTKAEFPLPKL